MNVRSEILVNLKAARRALAAATPQAKPAFARQVATLEGMLGTYQQSVATQTEAGKKEPTREAPPVRAPAAKKKSKPDPVDDDLDDDETDDDTDDEDTDSDDARAALEAYGRQRNAGKLAVRTALAAFGVKEEPMRIAKPRHRATETYVFENGRMVRR